MSRADSHELTSALAKYVRANVDATTLVMRAQKVDELHAQSILNSISTEVWGLELGLISYSAMSWCSKLGIDWEALLAARRKVKQSPRQKKAARCVQKKKLLDIAS